MVSNPYDPQRPSEPWAFAGRAEVVAKVEEFLAAARDLRRGGSLLLHGHRGSGKTSALRKIQSVARERFGGAVCLEVPLRIKSSESVLLRDLVEALRIAASERKSRAGRLREALGSVKGVNVSLLGAGVSVAGPERGDSTGALGLWRQCLIATRSVPLLCICIDDGELLDRSGLGTLKTIAETSGEVPILLAVAGGPGLMDRLSDPESSPIARVFSGAMFDIGAFSKQETQEALVNAHAGPGGKVRWSAEAVDRVWSLSHGYPYMVKCLAFAAFKPGKTIEQADVDESVQRALAIAGPWLDRELQRASDQDITSFVRIARLGRTMLSASDISAAGVSPEYAKRLVALGVLKRLSRGRYEMRKAPVIAYHKLLSRGLSA